MTIEKVILLKTLKAGSTIYQKGQVIPAPIPSCLLKENSDIVKLVEAELPHLAVLQPKTTFNENDFVESWIRLRASQYEDFVSENIDAFLFLSEQNLSKAISKWEKFYTTPCPLKDI